MEYSGKLYGKVRGEYFPLIESTEDVEKLKKRVSQLELENKELKTLTNPKPLNVYRGDLDLEARIYPNSDLNSLDYDY